jgi:hypothetical protein
MSLALRLLHLLLGLAPLPLAARLLVESCQANPLVAQLKGKTKHPPNTNSNSMKQQKNFKKKQIGLKRILGQ